MIPEQRLVAGLTCGDVLRNLSSYLDGELTAELRLQVEAHLAGCDWCERFGSSFASTIASLREHFAAPQPPTPAQVARLKARLRSERSSEPET